MQYKKKCLAITLAVLAAAPLAVQADIEIYGAAKLSVDYIDDGADTNVGVSNNSSRIGFRGAHNLEGGYKAVWQLESSVDFTGETGTLGTRDRYVGFVGPYGETRFGAHDTPFKDALEAFDPFDNTIGDRRNIIGLPSDGDVAKIFDLRARNSIMYLSPVWSGLQVHAMYSSDRNPPSATASAGDDNDRELGSAVLIYREGPVHVRAGFEKERGYGSGVRVAGSYQLGATALGAMIESLDGTGSSTDAKQLSRNAYGANVRHALNDRWSLVGQVVLADDSDAGSDTGAINYTVAVFHNLTRQVQFYAAYSATNNDANAAYRTASGGHTGDDIATAAPGLDPSALSIGMSVGF